MPTFRIRALCGVLFLLLCSTATAAGPIKATFRAEGAKKTLVGQRSVTLADSTASKDGDPAHSCDLQTAFGALNAGTGGSWTGQWSEGLGYYVQSIRGEKPSGNAYFELWVNHKQSSTGICDTDLDAGDDVLFFVQDCTFDPSINACSDPITPLGIREPGTLRKGQRGYVRVVDYSLTGKATPEKGATVYANGHKLDKKTDAKGRVRIVATKAGEVDVYATKRGKVRTEVETIRVKRS
jgi:hypothetical protein